MKVREFLYLMGMKPKPVQYGTVRESIDLPGDGTVDFVRWLHPGAYDPTPSAWQIANLRRYLRPGDVAVDIGAHAGDSVLPTALAVGPAGVVIAVEPNPFVFPVLEQLALLNQDKARIIPLAVAATMADGPVKLQYGDHGFCNGGIHEGVSKWVHGSAFEVTAKGRNLNSLLATRYPELVPRIRFIKIDTEGHDLAVLQSLEGLIRQVRPYLQVEFHNLRKSPPGYRGSLLAFLERLGYQAHRIDEGEGRFLAEPLTSQNMDDWNLYDAWCVPVDSRERD